MSQKVTSQKVTLLADQFDLQRYYWQTIVTFCDIIGSPHCMLFKLDFSISQLDLASTVLVIFSSSGGDLVQVFLVFISR